MKDNSKQLVSIVVPIFNGERYLDECMTTILGQSHPNLEIILINDGSTDSTAQMCDNFSDKDSRVKVVHQQNGGVSKARNTGLDLATGAYVAFVDADDTIHTDYIKNLLEGALANNADIVTTPASRIDMFDGKPLIDPGARVLAQDEAILELYRGRLEGTRDGMQMIRTDVLNDNSLRFDATMLIGEDFDFLARTILFSSVIVVDRRRMYAYRQNLSSAMQQEISQKHFEAIDNVARVGRSVQGSIAGLSRAIDTMIFSDAIYYAAKAYSSKQEWPDEYAKLTSYIKRFKVMVAFNSLAKRNTRIKAWIMIILGVPLGVHITRRLIRW